VARVARVSVTFRMAPTARDRFDRIAEVTTVDRSDVIRDALGQWLGQRDKDCAYKHKGPIVDGACGHCGKELG